MTCAPTPNAISSPGSAYGPSPFVAPAGQMIDLFGPVPVRANLSARQAKALGLLTSGTSGQPGATSSESVALQRSLASRLQTVAGLLGSTLYKLTWKRRATPSGRSISALRASVLRISAKDCGSWPTPTTRDWRDGGGSALQRRSERVTGQSRVAGGVANADSGEPSESTRQWHGPGETDLARSPGWASGRGALPDPRPAGPTNGLWAAADWLLCRDGKWRPVEPSTFPLADGAPARVGRLRAYGNAINAEAAAKFIASFMEVAA